MNKVLSLPENIFRSLFRIENSISIITFLLICYFIYSTDPAYFTQNYFMLPLSYLDNLKSLPLT